MELHAMKCDSNPDRLPPLTRREILDYLKKVPGWEVHDRKIVRVYDFENFSKCEDFFMTVADLSKREGHYPDIRIFEEKHVEVSFYTYSVGSLTTNDFVMAAKMNYMEKVRKGMI